MQPELSDIDGRDVKKGGTTCEKSFTVSYKKLDTYLYDPVISFLDILPKFNEHLFSHKNLHMNIYIA